ncbi:MAG: phage terminase small subunit P27 family [Deltaproteobacteria bacterium]|nr:phage terminase small subunit P27 family [Deltaproteobacteria bacterium]
MKGRKPKAPALKLLTGNKRTKKPPADIWPESSLPDPPPWLSDQAKTEWDRLAPLLYGHGLLSQLDRNALATYCMAYDRWLTAEAMLKESGLLIVSYGQTVPNPALKISIQTTEMMAKIGDGFGLSPLSRQRLHTKRRETSDPETDSL